MGNFKFWKAGVGVENFGPKHQNAHRYAKSGRINSSEYVAVAVFKRYTTLRKNARVYNNAALP